MKTIMVEGIPTEYDEVEPLHTNENWSIWQMPNGDVIKAKMVGTGFFYARGAKNKRGEPAYEIETKVIIKAIGAK